MSDEIKKAIIPVAGLGTRFIPLTLAVSKEFLPLVDRPVIQYILDEVKKSGITDVVFIISPAQKAMANYFEKPKDLERLLIKRKRDQQLKELKDFEASLEGLNISFVL